MEFLENKSPLLMKIALINHSVICIVFMIIFLILKQQQVSDFDIYYQIYVCSILFLFLFYMLYFAYHSVNYNNDYLFIIVFRLLELIKQNCWFLSLFQQLEQSL